MPLKKSMGVKDARVTLAVTIEEDVIAHRKIGVKKLVANKDSV
jgi:hypothetical protein